jgi:hypothetical protein
MSPDPRRSEPRAAFPGARVARSTAGWVLLVVGAALLVLPGPGIPLVLGGITLLAREQPWARRLQRRLRTKLPRADPP